MSFREKLRAFTDGLTEFYAGPYRATFIKARQQEDDLFMMLVL